MMNSVSAHTKGKDNTEADIDNKNKENHNRSSALEQSVIVNQNENLRSLKSKETIHKNEDGPDCTVSNNKFSSVNLVIWH